jgi:hypothetical protein
MNRNDLQSLANTRIREASILFEAEEYSGAYYLAGYAVECGLKACFAKTVREHDFPNKERTNRLYSHKLLDLVKLAGLETELSTAQTTSPRFSSGWDLVCEWSAESRYSVSTLGQSEAILNAIVRDEDGVLPWIKRYW